MASSATWAGFKAMNLRYVVSCSPCDRMIEIDPDTMPPDGSTIDQRFRCSRCGAIGGVIISHRSADKAYPGSRKA
ncbi:hypothetical protein [Rhizobium sp. L51/94]|uniref:hypothetical protein n=1 Tax=Rhizobium sp. L51/94 TaxID=2819999 RepID=UPI001C5B8D5E|nr:hypothetical protein [Rhizobium sp. L51/94]QXZ79681.1 hypothetical protein J5274_06780 [Rhizobium sp. L51/94]